ncbi:MAG: hypothetical protein PVS2B2_20640 [Candidatus Acidiferrum sp.]
MEQEILDVKHASAIPDWRGHFYHLVLCLYSALLLSGCASSYNTPPPQTTPPTAPTGLAAAATSSTQINLSWVAATDKVGVTGYQVERCQGAACSNFVQVSTTTSISFNDTGLAASTSYSYRVRATDAAGYLSGYSNVATAITTAAADTIPPTAPTSLSTAVASSTQINLSWTASTDNVGVTGYRLERCQGAGCSNFTQIASPTATTLNDTGLTASTSYSYRVRATDAAGNLSSYSNVATAVTASVADTTPPTAPTNLAAVAASSSQINLSWRASTDNVGVTGYKVERCQGAGCSNFTQIATPTATTLNDTGLTASTSYSYRVRATDAAGNLSGYSAIATASTLGSTVSVTVSPKRGGLATGQQLKFTATLTNDTQVVWSVSAGGSLSGQTPTTTVFSATSAGVYTITATSVADPNKIATATIGVTDLTGVTTYHNNLARDGANTREFALTTSNVATATFGKLFSCTVDGAIYAQPLWVPNLTVGGASHNVIFVATQHESVYAFDADASPCSTLWHFSLIDSAHGGTVGETSVPSGHLGGLVGSGFGDIEAEVGITGTPVIDPSTSTLYVASKSVNASTQFFQRLHALDLTTGNEKLNGNKPVLISASVPGDGDGSSGGIVAFDPRTEHQRPGLALVNGVVYIAWASHEDHDPYHGWVIGYSASTLAQAPGAVFNTTPNHVGTVSYSRGGVWMGGGAPAADASNNLYFITGNGTYDGLKNFGDSILRVSTSGGLSAADWFTPNDQATLDSNDTDLGSGASTILVDLPTAPVHQLLIGGGKEGRLYLLDRTNLGHFTPSDSGVVQSFAASNAIFATPAFWQNKLYYAAENDTMKMFTLDPIKGLFTPTTTPSATSHSTNFFSFPGSTPSVSATGTANGIIWALDNSQYGYPAGANGPAVLHAYDASNLTTEFWKSSQAAANRDTAGNAVKFTVPTVANGKVYVGTRTELDVYGLLPN